jgi:hypothetical protein
LVEIDGFAALVAGVCLVKLIGEYLFLFAAFGAFTDKRLEVLVILETGAMLRC